MLTSKYFIFISAITLIVLFWHSLSLFNGIQQEQKKFEKNKIETEIQNKQRNNVLASSCYRVEGLTTCVNFNGLFFNSSSIPLKKLIEFDKEVLHLSKGGKFYSK